MPEATEPWPPVLASGAALFVLGALVWMVSLQHLDNRAGMRGEDGIRAALGDIPSGQDIFAHGAARLRRRGPHRIAHAAQGQREQDGPERDKRHGPA